MYAHGGNNKMKNLYEKICRGEDRRANLIALKQQLKDEKNREIFQKITGGRLDEIMKCLVDADAKVRKNAVLILGTMRDAEAVDVLMDAYEEEDQLFIRADYVKALAELDCEEYLPRFHERLEELLNYEAKENERKHVQEEIRQLQTLIIRKEGIKKHVFTGNDRANDVIFLTLPAFRDVLAEQITGKKKLLKSGVRTVVTDMEEALKIRVFQEMLFVLKYDQKPKADARSIAECLKQSDLMQILEENHKGKSPFYFRIGISGAMPLEQRSILTRQTAAAIEETFSRQLINSASHYEIEIRLIQGADQTMAAFLKLYTLPDHRFDYRRYSVSASMKPYLAAGLFALAKPYLKEHAQVLDPFCGVGTMLLERRFALPVRNCYGIDIFGEAIAKARANSKIAGMQANYINRDFSDFRHDYLFDEIVTDMPSGNLKREELDTIYRMFFKKSVELLEPHGRIICYSREMGLVKKQLRLQNSLKLIKEFCIQEKNGAYLFVMEKKD